MSIETDGETVQRKMHDAISSLVRASAQNDQILDQLFAGVVALEQSAARRKLDGEKDA